MSSRTLIAGIDSSTQSCKVVILDPHDGSVLRQGSAPHPEGTSVDPEAWWQALKLAVAEAGGFDDVAAVSVGGQQHGMVALDHDGRVIRDALLWNDTRSAQAAADLVEELGAEAWSKATGLVPVASFTAAKLRWLRDNEPHNAARVRAIALPHDWLTWRLLGYGPADDAPHGPRLQALTTDASDASGTAYFSPTEGRYDLALFQHSLGAPGVEAAGVDAADEATDAVTDSPAVVLPRVLAPGAGAGTTPSGIVVGAGAGDNAAAGLGLGLHDGDVVVSLGTSGTVFASSGAPVDDPSGTVAGFASADGARLPLVATLNAARVLDAACHLLRTDHEHVAALALASEPGAAGLTLIPYFEGERTPNLPDATGQLMGMTLSNTQPEHVARAFVEGMLCGLADGLDAVQMQGVRADRVLLIGGAARNPAVREAARHIFTVPVDVPEQAEYVALGAARQAAWALTGALPTWPVARIATLHPRPSTVRRQYRSYTSAP